MAVFVITGARTGIGRECVRQLSTNPKNTVFALVRDVNGDISSLQDIKSHAQGKVYILGCDISSDESVLPLGTHIASLLETGMKINFIINNAAILECEGESSLAIPTKGLLKHVNSNVGGPARVVQSLLPHLEEYGIIANITSGIASMGLLSDGTIPIKIPTYSISKAALNMLTVHQAYELRGKAIVVCVDPGYVKTKMGGPEAIMEIPDSASGILSTLRGLKSEDSGKFLYYNGTQYPW